MKNIKIGKNKTQHYKKGKSIQEHDNEQRNKAIELSKNHSDNKPIKYLLKNRYGTTNNLPS